MADIDLEELSYRMEEQELEQNETTMLICSIIMML